MVGTSIMVTVLARHNINAVRKITHIIILTKLCKRQNKITARNKIRDVILHG